MMQIFLIYQILIIAFSNFAFLFTSFLGGLFKNGRHHYFKTKQKKIKIKKNKTKQNRITRLYQII